MTKSDSRFSKVCANQEHVIPIKNTGNNKCKESWSHLDKLHHIFDKPIHFWTFQCSCFTLKDRGNIKGISPSQKYSNIFYPSGPPKLYVSIKSYPPNHHLWFLLSPPTVVTSSLSCLWGSVVTTLQVLWRQEMALKCRFPSEIGQLGNSVSTVPHWCCTQKSYEWGFEGGILFDGVRRACGAKLLEGPRAKASIASVIL